MNRCFWVNLNNPLYVKYHDNEWGRPSYDDRHLFEMLILESFQAGLSWECILNKRDDFRKAFDNFDVIKVSNYDDNKIEELYHNEKIVMLDKFEPIEILSEGHASELVTYKGVMVSKQHSEKDMFKINLLNMINK